jgi:hypothetical protein
MKLPRPTFQIKPRASALLWSCALLSAFAAGCAPVVAQARFPARADTVMPGDLLGPFDGRVVDAATGKPIAGAIVQATWSYEMGGGLTAPAGAAVTTAATDNEGRYLIDRLDDLPPARSRVVGFTLVVYQRGYVAYRSDRVFAPAGAARRRHDFVQHDNVARMERWSAALSHVKHVRFVGGSGPLKRALGSELVEASLELTSGPPKAAPSTEKAAPNLNARVLLSADELKAVTGFGGSFTVEHLTDLPTTPSYDSVHFKATGQPESFDAALRVWKTTPSEAEARFAKLLGEVPHAEAGNEMGDRSLRGHDQRIVAVAALDRARGVVIELTCGLDQCRDADQAAALLRRVLARDVRLQTSGPAQPTRAAQPPTPAPAPASEQPTEETTPAEPPAPKAPNEENPFQLKPPELHR